MESLLITILRFVFIVLTMLITEGGGGRKLNIPRGSSCLRYATDPKTAKIEMMPKTGLKMPGLSPQKFGKEDEHFSKHWIYCFHSNCFHLSSSSSENPTL